MTAPSLDGLRFASAEPVEGGDVGSDTLFEYHEDEHGIWATYAGGAVRRGFLVGVRNGDRLRFRYCHLDANGNTATGRCDSVIGTDPEGRVILEETWQWESRPGHGTSRLVERSCEDSRPKAVTPTRSRTSGSRRKT